MWGTSGDGRLFKCRRWSPSTNSKGVGGRDEYCGEFDANNFNPIYGNSTAVTPLSCKSMFLIKW